ncbi:DUF4129 domain-containing protein [Actinokineospora xionganensis]|uniref:Protein-glutamine gamma-glutamyltransferase-like C-terminal domain-containing protein n=1 Tax=Actinokineospora xionganensis TaxID=2684470 RepID=A0ABR7LCB5_9PSEU|nr:DUF4129 domain-containing protein [Actinokineospora xionganensis]MBC6450320.1 hypothetical protein [Actinokineospora xionganensis]
MRDRLPVLLVVAAMLLLAVAAARGESAVPRGAPLGTVIEPPDSAVAPRTEPGERNFLLDLLGGITAGVFLLLAAVMLLVFVAGALAMLAGLRRRRARFARFEPDEPRRAELPSGGTPSDLVEAARAARVELSRRAGGPPADAIVAAWLVLENAAARRRAAHETPTEFTARVVAEQDLDATAVIDLRRLYHRARFGPPGLVTEADAAAASEALRRIESGVRS